MGADGFQKILMKESSYFKNVQANDEIKCLDPACLGLICNGVLHFKSHNESVHGQALRKPRVDRLS